LQSLFYVYKKKIVSLICGILLLICKGFNYDDSKNNVERLRLEAGLSIYELSKRCGFISSTNHVSNMHVKRAEQGFQVKIETALLIYRELEKAGVCSNFKDVFYLEDD
jgi:hypothetical protein